MKKGKKIVFVVVVLALLVAGGTALYLHYGASGAAKPQQITKSYDYPVKPGMQKWEELTDKRGACEIPEEVLGKLTTEALLDTVLNYPLLIGWTAHNTLDEGVESEIRQFNGLQELLRRGDAGEVVYKKYCEMPIEYFVSETNPDTYGIQPFLERLLMRDEIQKQLAGKQKEVAEQVIKTIQRKMAEPDKYYGEMLSDDIYEKLLEKYPEFKD